MSFGDLDLKLTYTTPEDDVINDFYIPVLRETVLYQRASAYFSSSSLLDIEKGIRGLINNNGKIQLIISPEISDKDAQAIEKGYELRQERQKFIENALLETFKPAENPIEEERYNLLSHLIEEGILDIKVAVMKRNPLTAIFHDKIGIMEDKNGNLISFSGSMNETKSGMNFNHESIDVYSSIGNDSQRTFDKRAKFKKYWNNEESSIDVFEFPESLKAKINEYHKENIDWEVVEPPTTNLKKPKSRQPKIPEKIRLFEYQKQAVQEWAINGFRGIYDMATGTGKTITALSSIVEITKRIKSLAIFIVVPYTHLVVQWKKDLEKFGIDAIEGYSSHKTRYWKSEFNREIDLLNLKFRSYICLVTTNASFRTKAVQDMVNKVDGEKLLIIDEAHNFGAPSLLKTLDDRFNYRLALSATLDRKYDLAGTDSLKDYFSPVCISYSLSQAIQDGRLCSYLYYPIPVFLTEDELEKYEDLSWRISRMVYRNSDGTPKKDASGQIKFRPEAKPLLIERARLVAGAKNKLEALKEVVKKINNKDHMLIYCGATTVDRSDSTNIDIDDKEIRQVDAVTDILRSDFGLTTAKYTSEQSSEERKFLTTEFDSGEIDSLIAIRCLDEGVDIPSTNKAIFLASSTNPKEYIQRRGRILRNFPGKVTAVIYDLVTLPRSFDDEFYSETDFDLSLVKRELERVEDFVKDSLNKSDSNDLIEKLEEKYGYSKIHSNKGD